jgi:TonB-linked SusC/RagA family outer membrane protein
MHRLKLLFVVLLLAGFSVMQAQAITGTITDGQGETLIGASVLVKGTTTGTVTDIDGNFSINVPANAERLVISYTGFTTQEVRLIASKSDYQIIMEENAATLGEIVVTGTGIATDRRRTAISVEAIDGEDLPNVASGSVDQALIGKIPGALIQSSSGQPGQQANIILRGINSLGGTTPMILIDGIQISTDNNFNGAGNVTSRLADIDFNNVERIEVVQGAAAATIYGAQGANGVIQIFTKKGRKGKPRITFSSSVGVGNPIFGDFGYADNHAYQVDGSGRILSGVDSPLSQDAFGVWSAPALEANGLVLTDNPYVEETYNLVDQVFKDNVSNARTSLSISGGGDNITYSVTGTYNNQQSAIRGGNERINFGSSLGFKIFDAVDVNVGLSLIRGNNDAGVITGQSNVFSALGSVATTFPFIDFNFRNANGDLVANPTGDNSVNPLYTETYRRREARLNRVLPNINLNWAPTEFLTLDYKYGMDYYRDDFTEFIDNQLGILGGSTQGGIDPITGRIQERFREGTLQNSIASAFLNFGDDDGFLSNTQFAFDWRQQDFNFVFAQGTGLPPFTPVNLTAAEESAIGQTQTTFVTYGFLVNQKLEYQGKVGASVGVRADYSSAFGEGSDPFVFPRGDLYVRLSEFDFWDGIKTSIPEFKFRTAYGQAGVQPGAFDRIRTLSSGQLGNNSFLAPQIDQTNPLLGVQVSSEFEAGVDISFTPGGRTGGWFPYFKLSATVWDRTSEDVIRAIGVAPSTGAATILDNAITLESNGIQASLQATVIDNPGFSWNSTFNFSRQRTVLADISNGVDIPVGNHFLLTPGQELGTFRGNRVLTSLTEQRFSM